MSDTELLPCPFCGNPPYVWPEVQGYGPKATCQNYKCRLDGSFTLDVWNKRAPITLDQARKVVEKSGLRIIRSIKAEPVRLDEPDCDPIDQALNSALRQSTTLVLSERHAKQWAAANNCAIVPADSLTKLKQGLEFYAHQAVYSTSWPAGDKRHVMEDQGQVARNAIAAAQEQDDEHSP